LNANKYKTMEVYRMTAKIERITILGTPDFKNFLKREAKREGVSLSQLVRQRCEKEPTTNEDEELLPVLIKKVGTATAKAKVSLEKGLADAEQVLTEKGAPCEYTKICHISLERGPAVNR
jgi:HSP90 family molecular chaperone